MSTHSTHTTRLPFFRRFWKPVAITGTGGTAVAIWFEEIILLGAEILSLILLPILAGVIYLLNIQAFKSRMPRREDLENSIEKGAQK